MGIEPTTGGPTSPVVLFCTVPCQVPAKDLLDSADAEGITDAVGSGRAAATAGELGVGAGKGEVKVNVGEVVWLETT